jgi:hypothetical protein
MSGVTVPIVKPTVNSGPLLFHLTGALEPLTKAYIAAVENQRNVYAGDDSKPTDSERLLESILGTSALIIRISRLEACTTVEAARE